MYLLQLRTESKPVLVLSTTDLRKLKRVRNWNGSETTWLQHQFDSPQYIAVWQWDGKKEHCIIHKGDAPPPIPWWPRAYQTEWNGDLE